MTESAQTPKIHPGCIYLADDGMEYLYLSHIAIDKCTSKDIFYGFRYR